MTTEISILCGGGVKLAFCLCLCRRRRRRRRVQTAIVACHTDGCWKCCWRGLGRKTVTLYYSLYIIFSKQWELLRFHSELFATRNFPSLFLSPSCITNSHVNWSGLVSNAADEFFKKNCLSVWNRRRHLFLLFCLLCHHPPRDVTYITLVDWYNNHRHSAAHLHANSNFQDFKPYFCLHFLAW